MRREEQKSSSCFVCVYSVICSVYGTHASFLSIQLSVLGCFPHYEREHKTPYVFINLNHNQNHNKRVDKQKNLTDTFISNQPQVSKT